MIKLLLITNRYPAHADDSASPFVADFVRTLSRHDIETTVLTPRHQADKYELEHNTIRFEWGERIRTIGSLPKLSPLSWLKIYKYFTAGQSEAQRLHQEHQFDFCLALWAAPSGIFARRLKLQFGLPYAVWCLGSDIHSYPKLPIVRGKIIDVLKDAAIIYSDGYALGEAASDLCGREVRYLPSMRRVSASSSKSEAKEKLFVCPGRVEKSKGVFELLDAFRPLAYDHPDWQLYFIGEGSAREKLEKAISHHGLDGQVKSLGFVKRENLYRAITKCTAVVIPTRADSLPLTFGEAMQLRRPVIATDIGDLRLYIEKYGVGRIVPALDNHRLTDALREFMECDVTLPGKYDECVQALSIDRAGDTFADWLHSFIEGAILRRETVVC